MECLDISLNTPEENLALDEALLYSAENGSGDKILRFWETNKTFVVLASSSRYKNELHMERCKKDNIKILRRISGGGAVLQGKGCLNYCLILPYNEHPSYKSIKGSYEYILTSMCDKLSFNGLKPKFFPTSDIAINEKKVSGNAQCRKRRFFMHHGTFLYDFDIGKVSFYLANPKHQPEYRHNRVHCDFLANLEIESLKIKEILKDQFDVTAQRYTLTEEERNTSKRLVAERYLKNKWNFRH